MKIYAKIEDGMLHTEEEAQEGYTEYEVTSPLQLDVKEIEQEGEVNEEDKTFEIVVLPFREVKKFVFAQIENVYTYLINTNTYEEGTLSRRLLDEAKTKAETNVEYITPPVTSEEQEEGFKLQLLKEDKLKEVKLKKKAFQGKDVVSKIGSKDYTFFGGVENANKYNAVLNLLGASNKKEIRVKEGLVKIGRNDLMMAVGKLANQAYEGWLKETKLMEPIYMAQDEDSIEAVTWTE